MRHTCSPPPSAPDGTVHLCWCGTMWLHDGGWYTARVAIGAPRWIRAITRWARAARRTLAGHR